MRTALLDADELAVPVYHVTAVLADDKQTEADLTSN